MPEPHLAINGYFLDHPHSGSGQYLLHLLEQLDTLWPGPITVLVPGLVIARSRPWGDPEGATWQSGGGAAAADPRARELPSRQPGAAGDHGAASNPVPRIATSPTPPPPPHWLFAMTQERGRVVRPLAVPLPGALGKVWFEQVGVPRAAQSAGADLLHIPYFGAPVSSPVPVVVTVHDLIQLVVPRLRGGPLNRGYNLIAAVGARRAAAVITDSGHVRADVLHRLRVPPDRVSPIPLAVDARFHPVRDNGEDTALRNRHSLQGPFILYAGGLDWRKNVPLLIRSYARSGVTIPLVIAGEARSTRASSFPDLHETARQAGAADRVRFIPMEEDSKPALYRAAALYVCPSLAEGFGLTPLEALACGTPVICSSATSLPEVVGDAALLFEPTDEEGLSRLIVRIFAEEGLAGHLRIAGPQQAKRFSWRATAEQTMAVYQDVVESFNRRSSATPRPIVGPLQSPIIEPSTMTLEPPPTRTSGLPDPSWRPQETVNPRNLALTRAVAALAGRQGRVLEVGAGAARFSRAIAGRLPAWRTYACDIDRSGLIRGRETDPDLRVAQADMTALPFAGGAFDAVVLFDVLEHLKQPVPAVRELARVLRPGGILHALVPCEGQPATLHWLMWKTGLAAGLKERSVGHVQRFTHDSLSALLQTNGLEIESVSYSMHWLGQIKDVLLHAEDTRRLPPRLTKSPPYKAANAALWLASYAESRLLQNAPLTAVAVHLTARRK